MKQKVIETLMKQALKAEVLFNRTKNEAAERMFERKFELACQVELASEENLATLLQQNGVSLETLMKAESAA